VVAMATAGAISYRDNSSGLSPLMTHLLHDGTRSLTPSRGCVTVTLLQREINQQPTGIHLTNHLIIRAVWTADKDYTVLTNLLYCW